MKSAFEVLDSIGWPRRICVVDFESFFDRNYNLSKFNACEYITDKRFEAQVVGYCDSPGGNEVIPGWNFAELKRLNAEDVVWSFQNAHFDAAILAMLYNIHPRWMIDTKMLHSHLWPASPHNLKDMAKQLGLNAKGDTMNFIGQRYATMSPAMQRAYIDYTANDVELQYRIGMKLLPLIDNPAIELPAMQHTIELLTKPVLRFDSAKADEIRKGMVEDTASAVAKTGCTEEQISGNKSFERLMVTALTEAGDDPKKYFKPIKKGEALAIAKDDGERYELLKHDSMTVRTLMNARVAKKSWPSHLRRIAAMASLAKCWDGAMPVPLNYYGCITGRPSGGFKINLLNLPKRGHDLLLMMRETLAAWPRHKVVSLDLSGIEDRILMWLTDTNEVLARYAAGGDPYSDFAEAFFGCLVYKPSDDELPLVAKRLKKQRGFGKVCRLGMGYQMGAAHFMDYAEAQGSACDFATAEKAVDFYRRKHPNVVQFWYDLSDAFYFAPNKGTKIQIEAGWNGPSSRSIRLPSGRQIRYPELKGERSAMMVQWSAKSCEHVYGGLLTENICQGIARCILTEAIDRIERRGFHVCHHIYDQMLFHVKDAKAEECLAAATEELTRRPVWAPDLPLAAEGTIRDTYAVE